MSPPALFVACALAVPALDVLVPGTGLAPAPWSLLGVGAVVGGALLHASAVRRFRDAGTTLEPDGRPTRLVTGGVFGVSRNPMYVAGALILAGLAALLGSAAGIAVAGSWMVAAGRYVRREERTLARRFGEEYVDYRTRVRRWL